MTEPIRIMIADDHPIVRRGLRTLIETSPDMEIVGEAEDGAKAVEMARDLRPDVILLDLLMPKKDGVGAINEIKRDNADACILVLTSFVDDNKVFPAIRAGALGYLLKDSQPEDLLNSIREVHQGRVSLHPAIARKVIQEVTQPTEVPPDVEVLTEREVDVLRLVARGFGNHEIAKYLDISERTVGTHTSNILKKLHLANRTQAALYALRIGLTELE